MPLNRARKMTQLNPPKSITQPVERDVEHEMEMNTLGMWIFLVGEVLFFGALFTAYMVYRYYYPETFAEASRTLDVVLGTINTFILLTSSLTMALAVNAAQIGKRKLLVAFLLITVLLGLAFVGIKGYEYLHKIEEGLFPGTSFLYQGEQPGQARMFFSLYFIMTGLHAIHMLLGMGMLLLLAILSWLRVFNRTNYAPIELTGLFWHFVDLVWIFLFPLLYLIDRV
jgi:cytochrome c oxidase subunit III